MAGRDDVRIRLSAEGVAEVVAALRKVATESKRTADVAHAGFLNLGGALAGVNQLLGAFGIALGVSELIRFGESAALAAEQTGHFSRQVGASVENVSTLAFVTRQAGQDLEGLRQPLVQFDRKLVDLQDGVSGAVEAFGAFGLKAKDLVGKDAIEALDVLSQRYVKLKSLPSTVAATFDLLGRRSAALSIVMNELGREGLDKTKEKAKALGAVMSGEMVKAAENFNKQLRTIQLQLQVASVAFLSGFLPAVTQTLSGVGDATGKNADQWKKWGEAIGVVLKAVALIVEAVLGSIVSIFAAAYATIAGIIEGVAALFNADGVAKAALAFGDHLAKAFSAKSVLGALVEAAQAIYGVVKDLVSGIYGLLSGDSGALNAAAKAFGDKIKIAGKIITDRVKSIGASAHNLVTAPAKTAASSSDDSGDEELKQLQKFSILEQRRRVEIESTLKITEAALKAEQDAEDSAFSHSLTSVEAHYAKRRAIVEESFKAEKKALEDRLALESKNPDVTKRTTAVTEIRSELQVLNTKHGADVAASAVDEADARIAATHRVVEIEAKLGELKGDEHLKRKQEIEDELKTYVEALRVEGVATEERDRRVSELRRALEADEKFSAVSSRVSVTRDQTDLARTEIQSKIDAGVTSQVEGQKQLLDLYTNQLPILREAADELERAAEATGDPAKIDAAKQFQQEVNATADALRGQEDVLRRVTVTLEDSATGALADFFATGIEGAKSFGEAFRNMAGSIVQAIQRMLSQMLAMLVVQKLIQASSLFFGGGGVVRGGTTAGEITGGAGSGTFAARGGLIRRGRSATAAVVRSGFAGGGAVAVGSRTRSEGRSIWDLRRTAAAGPGAVSEAVESVRRFMVESSVARGLEATGARLAGGGRAFPIGGRVTGPGGSMEDAIPAWLSHGEFVVRAAVVSKPGILDHLRKLNAGTVSPEVREYRGARQAFSGGGLVVASGPASAASASKAEVGLTVGLAPGLVADQLTSPEGQRTVVRIVRANRNAIGSSIRG
jgi:hypothetical protein